MTEQVRKAAEKVDEAVGKELKKIADKAGEVATKAGEVVDKTGEAVGQELKSGWAFAKGLGKELKKGIEKKNRHTVDIKEKDLTELCIDLKQMGVGGDTSWGAKPHPQYQLNGTRFYFSITIKLNDIN